MLAVVYEAFAEVDRQHEVEAEIQRILREHPLLVLSNGRLKADPSLHRVWSQATPTDRKRWDQALLDIIAHVLTYAGEALESA